MLKNPSNLLNLQNLMKRDPSSYSEEFRQQHANFNAHINIFTLSNDKQAVVKKDFAALVTFLSHVAPCFREMCKTLPSQLLDLLTNHSERLDSHLRRTLITGLILLQNRHMIDRFALLPALFKMFAIPDKSLREQLFAHIVHDIRRVNKGKQNLKVNSALQSYMYTMLKDSNVQAAKKSLDVIIELWKRKIWTDAKTVNAIAQSCFSKESKIMIQSLRFFLGIAHYEEDPENEENEESKDDVHRKIGKTAHSLKGMIKNTKKRERIVKRAVKKINKLEKNGQGGHSSVIPECPAIHLVHDAQTFAERLFSQCKSSSETFQTRMLMMNVISRLIGAHQLQILNFYPYLQKYMQPHQRNVTHILTFLAQSSHPLVPPDVLRPCVLTLANHFVTDRSSSEVMAVGINAIREVCARSPLVMERDLLLDLAQYKKSKIKGVMMASRSLIALFRDINPKLLHKKDRGKFAGGEGEENELEYGYLPARTDIVGADLLSQILPADGDAMDGAAAAATARDDEEAWNVAVEPSDSEEEEDEEEDLADPSVNREVDDYIKKLARASDDEEEEEDGDDDDGEKTNGDVREMTEEDFMALSGDEEGEGEEEEDGEEEGEGEDMDEGMEVDDDDDDDQNEDENDGEAENDSSPKKKRKVSESASVKTGSSSSSSSSSSNTATGIAAESTQRKLPLGALKIFTPRDFEQLRELKMKSILESSGHKGGDASRKRKSREDGSTLLKDKIGEIVERDDIIGYVAKKRADKQSRLESIQEGREGRGKFAHGTTKGGGSNNRDKEKNKAFMMVKNKLSVKNKKNISFSAQQAKHASHLTALKNLGSKMKKKMKKGRNRK